MASCIDKMARYLIYISMVLNYNYRNLKFEGNSKVKLQEITANTEISYYVTFN